MTFPSEATPLSVPMPPMLPDAIDYSGQGRYFAIWYQGSKATWSDGRSMATFPYFAIYQRLMEHPVMGLIHPLSHSSWEFGDDDAQATKVLLCDREEQRMAVCPFDLAMQFLREQHPPLQPLTEEGEARLQQLISDICSRPPSLEDLKALGMFETFLGAPQRETEAGLAIAEWLNDYVARYRGLQTED